MENIELRDPWDFDAGRTAIFKTIPNTLRSLPPVSHGGLTLRIDEVDDVPVPKFTLAQQKKAIMTGTSLDVPVRGVIGLYDEEGKQVSKRKTTLARIPYLTQRGTFIKNGSMMSLAMQKTRRSGVYVRETDNGQFEGLFKSKDRSGFNIGMDPASGKVFMRIYKAKVPIYSALSGMGLTDEEIKSDLGKLYDKNVVSNSDAHIRTMWEKLGKGVPVSERGYTADIMDIVNRMEVDPKVTARTLGKPYDRLNKDVIRDGLRKVLAVYHGDTKSDDMDSLSYQQFASSEDHFKRGLTSNHARLAKQILFKAAATRTLDHVPSNVYKKAMEDTFFKSQLGVNLEDINPLESLDLATKVTGMGLGGFMDGHSVPDSARLVHSTQLGMIDSIRSPECHAIDKTEVMTDKGWKKAQDVTLEDRLATIVEGELQFNQPSNIFKQHYCGPMYGVNSRFIEMLVTPNHRLWTRPQYKLDAVTNAPYRFELAGQTLSKGTCRLFRTGGHPSYVGNTEVTKRIGPHEINIVDWCSFMGWYLSEGCADHTYSKRCSHRYRVRISQVKEDGVGIIKELLARLPYTFHYSKADRGFTINNVDLCKYVLQFGKSGDKFIPEELFCAPLAARTALLEALMLGDGKHNGSDYYCTTSDRLRDDVARLAFGLGYAASYKTRVDQREERYMDTHEVCLHKINERFTSVKYNYVQEYSGDVWCATVPGGIMYVRYNGKLGHWSGNSGQVGVDGRLAFRTLKGSDGELYHKFLKLTGESTMVGSTQVDGKSIAFREEYEKAKRDGDKYVPGMRAGSMTYIPIDEVELLLPNAIEMFNYATNLIPGLSGVKGMRALMGCLHPNTCITVLRADQSVYRGPVSAYEHKEGDRIRSCSTDGKVRWELIFKKVPNPKQLPMLRIVLSSGRELITTTNHQWSTKAEDGTLTTIRADRIELGTAVPRSVNAYHGERAVLGHVTLNPDNGFILGCAVAYGLSSCECVTADEAMLRWLHDVLDPDADHIPAQLFYAELDTRRAFLAGYLSKNGFKNTAGAVPSVRAVCTSKRLRDDLGDLLSSVGIDSTYTTIRQGAPRYAVTHVCSLDAVTETGSDITWDTVVDIYPAAVERTTYDLDLDDKTFVADGIIVHNSKYSVTADTEVTIKRSNGRIWVGQIRNYVHQDGDSSLCTSNDNKTVYWQEVTQCSRHNFAGRIFTIHAGGRTVCVTDHHSMVVLTDGVMQEVFPQQMKLGDLVPVIPTYKVPNAKQQRHHMYDTLYAMAVIMAYLIHKRVGAPSATVTRRLKAACDTLYSTYGTVCVSADRVAMMSQLRDLLYVGGGEYQEWLLLLSNECKHALICGMLDSKPTDARHTCTPEVFPVIRLLASTSGLHVTGEVQRGCMVLTFAGPSERIRTSSVPVVKSRHLSAWANGGVYAEEITSITTRLSAGEDVYDLHMKDNVFRTTDGIIVHNTNQALSLTDREAPLVRAALPDDAIFQDFNSMLGAKAGAVFSDVNGTVTSITPDAIHVTDDNGNVKEYEMHDNYPLNRKAYIHNTPLVKIGDTVEPGIPLADSNFTKNGVLAQGKHLKVAYLSDRGYSFEDGITLSESGAKKLVSEHMYPITADIHDSTEMGLGKFISMFPGKYKEAQLNNLDDQGVVRPGTIVQTDDPLILTMSRRQFKGQGMLQSSGGKSIRDESVTWEHHDPGVVTDVHVSKDGVRLSIKSTSGMHDGDKLSGIFGNKGVTARILPDNEMPVGEDGQPLDALINKNGVISRHNPAQVVVESLRAKMARALGKPEVVSAFTEESSVEETERLLRAAGISPTETLTTPEGRKLKNVTTGLSYMLKLHHQAENKASGVGDTGYTITGAPTSSPGEDRPKRMGTMDVEALLAHGAIDVLRDFKLIKGQDSREYLTDIMSGKPPKKPTVPAVYNKFIATLKASGINVKDTGDAYKLSSMSDDDIIALSAGPVTKNATVKWKTDYSRNTAGDMDMDPVAGGLFDRAITGGMGGDRYSHIPLPVPLPQPVFEKPIRTLLGLTEKGLNDVLAGRTELGSHGTGPHAIKNALSSLDVNVQLAKAIDDYKGTDSISKKDLIAKRIKALKGIRNQGINPADMLVSNVLVIPPKFRPISINDKFEIVADSNLLYKSLIDASDNYKGVKQLMGDRAGESTVETLYKAYKAVTGLGDPIRRDQQEQGVNGLLKGVFGPNGNKTGIVQKQLIGTPASYSARGVIIPDPALNMDQIGIPEDKAWDIFKVPLIQRMVRATDGSPEAKRLVIKQVLEKAPAARRHLDAEMQIRPITYNRAPVLHRYGNIAGFAHIVAGDAIRTNPMVCKGLNADYDGNCIVYSTKINTKFACNVPTDATISTPELKELIQQEYGMKFTHQTKVVSVDAAGVTVEMAIGDLPHGTTFTLDKKGAKTYEVPQGVSVLSVDPVTLVRSMQPVLKFTEELVPTTSVVETSFGITIEASNNESLRVYDKDTGKLVKWRADASAVGMPVCRIMPETYGSYSNVEFGWMLGAYLSDGYVTGRRDAWSIGYSKIDQEKQARFEAAMRMFGFDGRTAEYEREAGDKSSFGRGYQRRYYGVPKQLMSMFHACYEPEFFTDDPSLRRGCVYKRLPTYAVACMDKQTRLALLSGLLDGDGSISSATKSTKKTQGGIVQFSTSSPTLAKDLVAFAWGIGVRASITEYKSTTSGNPAFFVVFSRVDIDKLRSDLHLCAASKDSLDSLGVTVKDDRDLVPVPEGLLVWLSSSTGPLGAKSRNSIAVLRGPSRRDRGIGCTTVVCSRSLANTVLSEIHSHPIPDKYAELVSDWEKIVSNTKAHWGFVTKVTDTGTPTLVYDVMVPTKVFCVEGGLVIEDTFNYNGLISAAAVKDAERMLPSRNLRSAADFKLMHTPMQDFRDGLSSVARARKKSGRLVTDVPKNREAILAAYKRGDINLEDDILV